MAEIEGPKPGTRGWKIQGEVMCLTLRSTRRPRSDPRPATLSHPPLQGPLAPLRATVFLRPCQVTLSSYRHSQTQTCLEPRPSTRARWHQRGPPDPHYQARGAMPWPRHPSLMHRAPDARDRQRLHLVPPRPSNFREFQKPGHNPNKREVIPVIPGPTPSLPAPGLSSPSQGEGTTVDLHEFQRQHLRVRCPIFFK